jgi:hypothetical protein
VIKEMSKTISEEERHVVFSVTMPKSVVREIDRTRGFMPRSAWLKALAINELKKLQSLRGLGANPKDPASEAVGTYSDEIKSSSTIGDDSNG